jgi:hypothetical protein
MTADAPIRRAAQEAQQLLDEMYAVGAPSSGSALDQAGLRDGLAIVDDYLAHGEAGVAFEHLLYMISEPQLRLSRASLADVAQAASLLGMSSHVANLHLA